VTWNIDRIDDSLRRGRGGSNLYRVRPCVPALPSVADFFSAPPNFQGRCRPSSTDPPGASAAGCVPPIGKAKQQESLARSPRCIGVRSSGEANASLASISLLFSTRPTAAGGRSNVWDLSTPDRRASRTHLFASFREFFSSGARVVGPRECRAVVKKRREIHPRGVAGHWTRT
jgi:hypothetical protein